MDFPMLRGNRKKFPAENKCAWCCRDNVCEPNSMAVLTAGAVFVNRKTANGGPDSRLDGFLDICWHGAHIEEGGKGEYPNIFKNISLARDVIGGQFDIYFCSTICLRAFLNNAIDQLENEIEKK